MTVYIDPPVNHGGKFKNCSHMWADNLDELHAFAQKIGLKRSWFQDRLDLPHYDVFASKRNLAIRSGAVEVGTDELVATLHRNQLNRSIQEIKHDGRQ